MCELSFVNSKINIFLQLIRFVHIDDCVPTLIRSGQKIL